MRLRRFLILALCAFLAAFVGTFALRKFRTLRPLAGHTSSPTQPVPALVRSLRPSYPYSIIPGGAYSAAELRFANQRDEIVRNHYSNFDLKAAKLVQSEEDHFQYVSYRLKNQIYWTRKKLLIPMGELLLTDGANYARARCGNRLSNDPHKEISESEPPLNLLTLPPVRPDLLPKLELADAPPLGELAQAFPARPDEASRTLPILPSGATVTPAAADRLPPIEPIFPIIPVIPGTFLPSAPPPTISTPPNIPPTTTPVTPPPASSIPEPSSIYLFLVTFLISLWALTRMMPKEGADENTAGKSAK